MKSLKTSNSFQQESPINVKRVFDKAIKYWYVILISITLTLAIAVFVNRYTEKTYAVSMSLAIKPAREASPAAELYRSAGMAIDRNYDNEIYLLKSYPFIKKVVEKLNFNFAFYKEGSFMTTQLYPGLPLDIYVDTAQNIPYNKPFHFEIVNNNQFLFGEYSAEKDHKSTLTLFNFGDTIQLEKGYKLFFNKYSGNKYIQFAGEKYIFKIISPASLISKYRGKVNIGRAGKSASIFNLSMVGSNPQMEMDFLNELASTYIQHDLDSKNENANKTIAFIDEQLGQITDSLRRIEKRLERFKSGNASLGLNLEAQRIYGKLEPLEASKAEMILLDKYYEYLTEYLEKDHEANEILVPSNFGISDGILNQMIAELVSLQITRETLTKGLNTDHPHVITMNDKIRSLKETILENINNHKASSKIRKEDINQRIAVFEKEIYGLPKSEREFVNIKRVYDLNERLYLFLMEKKAEAGIKKASTVSDIAIINPPMLMGGAITPQTSKNYMIAFIVGLLIPIGLFILGDMLDSRVSYKEDLEKLTNIPFLGMVGHNGMKANTVVLNKPKSAVAESFRAVRSNIHYFTADKEKKVIVLTSSLSGEGKTFCSMNLALVFSLSGKKTLLIGADLRKPKIYEDFNLYNDKGLSNYLANLVSLQEVIQQSSVDHLDVISGGTIPPNPSELLMSSKMEKMIESLKEQYDYIIIDTPPVGIVTDAFMLMNFADHNIFLVRQNYTPKETVKNVQQMYESGKVKNISILYNDVKAERGRYAYGYGYGYGSGYYEEELKKTLWKRLKDKVI